GGVSWNSAKHGTVAWTSAGLGNNADRQPDTIATSAVTTGAWSRFNVTPIVQDWVSGVLNYGISIADKDATLGGTVTFLSSDTSLASARPKLVVYYDTDTITIVKQEGTTDAFSETFDTYLSQAEPNNNFGASDTLFINSTDGSKKHILLNMKDMVSPNSIVAGSKIAKAELVLYRSNTTAIPADGAKAWQSRQRWNEGLQDGSAGLSNWNYTYNTGKPWKTIGSSGYPDVDTMSMSTGNTVNNTIGGALTIRFDSAAQHWSDGALTRGLAVLPNGVISGDAGFYSADGAAAISQFYAPKVVVTFAGGTGAVGSVPWTKPDRPLLKTYASITGRRDTIRVREGDAYGSTDDCVLLLQSPSTNQDGAGNYINAYDTNHATNAKKSVIKFTNFIGSNAGQVPANCIIDTAYIRLVEYSNSMEGTISNLDVHIVNESWVENQVTWNNKFSGSAWANSGARKPNSSSLIYRNVTLTDAGWNDTVIIPLTYMVRQWVNGAANNGILLVRTSNDASGDISFYTSEAATSTCRPQLVVAYRKKEQVEIQNVGRFANENSRFSDADSLSGQFFMSFNTRSDSTDGMFNQMKTAATSPGEQIKQSYDLLPTTSKHQNLFNILRRPNGTSDWSYYADSVRSSETISFTVVESTTTRIRYRVNPRTIRDAGSFSRNTSTSTEFTVYPTGQIVVFDSSLAASSTNTYNYAVNFHTKDGNGTLYDNDSTLGGMHSTLTGKGTLHDWAFGILGYSSGSLSYSQSMFNSVTNDVSASNYSGISFYNSTDNYFNSSASVVKQSYYLDMSRDDLADADTLEAMVKDKQYPSILNDFRTGTLKTNAAGDLNSDGFNEREGVYELQCDAASGEAYFWFNKDSIARPRYMPAFKVNGYTWAHAPTKVMLITQYERVIDTCYASKGDVNISLVNAGASGYLVFQLNRIINGPCVIYIGRDDNLAVEMNTFSGNADSGTCKLTWSTESEHENRGFRLLRRELYKSAKTDTSFAVIADYETHRELVGKITTQSRSEYSFADHRVALGKTYEYALEAVDMKGKAERYAGTVILTVDQLFGFALDQNYPNPFNPTTVIKYSVPGKYSTAKKQVVSLSVFDIKGRLVKTLSSEEKLPGAYTVFWNGKANNGRLIASGVYFYRIDVAGRFVKIRKMVVVK
ncbi:MAG: DNRLRE domain-containing protein, partial [Fibrobacteres bacterium]|nr:DNRLRE domain-containing protein [Fibrobacterota bacterium]